MPIAIVVPPIGSDMTEVQLVAWHKREGDAVAAGDVLCEVESAKATVEVTSPGAGVLLKQLATVGQTLPIGATLAYIGAAGEAVPGGAAAPAAPPVAPSPAPPPASTPPPPSTTTAPSPAEVFGPSAVAPRPAAAAPPAAPPPAPPITPSAAPLSPLARRLAEQHGVSLSGVQGSGRGGRIMKADVEARLGSGRPAPPAPQPPAPSASGSQPLSATRRATVAHLAAALEAPQFHIEIEAGASELVREREAERWRTSRPAPTYTDLLIKLCALTLRRHPLVNAAFRGDHIEVFPSIDIGVAVGTDDGLYVPVVRGADRLELTEIAAQTADFSRRAREQQLHPQDLAGGSFTISNLGMYGVDRFAAVLNPPQAAILAVGSIRARPTLRDGVLLALPTVHLTLTCDHRALDGLQAAAFLSHLVTAVEHAREALTAG